MNFSNSALTLLYSYKIIDKHNWRAYFPVVLFYIIAIVWVAAAYKFSDWRNFKAYYPTILFFWCGNLIYNLVFHDALLWKFENPFYSHKLIDFYNTLLVSTSTTLIYLSRFPRKLGKQILYILTWIALYSLIELVFISFDSIVYFAGWTFWWSVIHNTYQFLLLKLHHHKPAIAWLFAITILIVIMTIFHVSI